ncbi:hypothetical protein BU25DRAFT_363328 [Macroventuria anomochaeta]|uniref:Uncharacterized protein n=1 Tax=Macroventuria anomochaeta TaxID=301207 RepID=A0ACB6SA36_9PLEO|nr:uncharacterized protein BU25DRAFT_363328 [Macroventuria anomochaeta]KAF2630084.1 hypothetical protein BU25DRAFT_363328 [Macroventuria anomochaeta]
MRRPPIACQRAVQSLQSPAPQHIWVPDEVLSLAVHRFFHSTCPQQKRHGSNVPGPLEARRRAAKRRMTASAGFYPQESFPTSFSLGALFGYRSKPQNSWRYEPPSLPKDVLPLDNPLATWNSARPVDFQPQSQASEPSPVDRDILHPFAQQPASLTETWNQHFDLEAVSQNPPKPQAIGHILTNDNEFEKCLEGFEASICVAGDSRTELLLKESFRQYLPSAPFVWKYYTAALRHTLQLGCNPTPVLQCLLEEDGRLLRSVNPLQIVNDCAGFIACLDRISNTKRARKTSLVRRIFGVMAQSAAEARRSTTEAHDLILLRLIKHTGHSASYRGSERLVPTIRLLRALAANLRESAENRLLLSHLAQPVRVKGVIISTIRSVAMAPDGFASAERALFYMPRKQLLTLIPAITLRFANSPRSKRDSADPMRSQCMDLWLQLLDQVDAKANVDKALLKAAMVPLAEALHFYDAPAMVPPEYFVRAMILHQQLDAEAPSTTSEPRRFQALFAEVLLQIQEQPRAYTALLDMALPIIARHAGLSLLLRCIRTMEEQKLPLSTRMDFESLIAKKLAMLHTSTDDLSESQLQSRAFTLQACEKLTKVLSRMGHALPARMEEVATLSGIRQFDNLLVHAKAKNALPIAYRDVTSDLSLMERVAMVHQLAHHYSQDTTRTHREVWRSIYYLYHYLRSNSLPIGPLFTKAVVHSSITRPLMENRFVSARRLIWVCHLVARVEGDEVAARLENRFFTWRGDLIGHAKRVFVGVGGGKQNKAHVGTMKRLGLL